MSNLFEIEPLYSEILPGLFISGTDDYDVLGNSSVFTLMDREQPFDSVVTLYVSVNPFGNYVREQRFAIPDGPIEDSIKPELMQLAYWLHGEWKMGKRAAGRCQAGWNRSSLIVALVLLIDGLTADEAIDLIRERRSKNALCNSYFVDYIHEIYETEFRSPSLQAS